MGQAHSQGIVAAGGSAHPDAEPGSDADEQCPGDGGQQRKLGDSRPQRRELFADPVARGVAQGGYNRIADEFLPQGFPAQQIAAPVEDQAAEGGRQSQPVIQQQNQSENAPLRDPGQGVNIVHAESLEGRGEKGHGAVPRSQLWQL